jgi:hypothetical protein
VWLSFLSASTPVWLLKTVNPNVVEGGFTSRCLFIISNEPKQKIPWPDDTDGSDERAWLLSDLRSIREHAANSDPILLTDGALAVFRGWYHNRHHSLDIYRQSFEAREDAHVLRLAALLCINDDTWRIDHHHIGKAIQLVASLKDASSSVFEDSATKIKYTGALDAIRTILVSRGMDPVAKYELTRKCKRKLELNEFNSLLEVLYELGAIQRFIDPMHERGRPVEYYRGTNTLLAKGLGEQVLEKFV